MERLENGIGSSGKVWAGLAALGALTAIYALVVERIEVRLDEYTLEIDRPGLPPDGLTILHISDLHLRHAGGWIQRRKLAAMHRRLRGVAYDVVAVTGDLIHDAAAFPLVLALLDRLQPRRAAFSVPGNHDYCESSAWGVFGTSWAAAGSGREITAARLGRTLLGLWHFGRKVLRNEHVNQPVAFNDVPAMQAALQAHGIQPLVNRAVPYEERGAGVWFAGLDDLTEGRPDLAAALASVPEGAVLVLLAHNPDAWLDPRAGQADLILAGHTHGGQVQLPFLGAIHTQGTHLARRHPAGWFSLPGRRTRMFVSRGAGESLPLRLGAPPQMALIRLVPHRPSPNPCP